MVRRLSRRQSRQRTASNMSSSRRFYLCVAVGSMLCLSIGCFSLKSSSSSVKERSNSSVCADTPTATSADTNKKQGAMPHGSGHADDSATPYNGDMSYGNVSSADVKQALRNGVGSTTIRHDSRTLPVVAREILQNYQTSQSCILVSSGYLDLWGNAWMCMVSGGAWVEICLVTDRDRKSCEVQTLRMTCGEWEAAYGSTRS